MKAVLFSLGLCSAVAAVVACTSSDTPTDPQSSVGPSQKAASSKETRVWSPFCATWRGYRECMSLQATTTSSTSGKTVTLNVQNLEGLTFAGFLSGRNFAIQIVGLVGGGAYGTTLASPLEVRKKGKVGVQGDPYSRWSVVFRDAVQNHGPTVSVDAGHDTWILGCDGLLGGDTFSTCNNGSVELTFTSVGEDWSLANSTIWLVAQFATDDPTYSFIGFSCLDGGVNQTEDFSCAVIQ